MNIDIALNVIPAPPSQQRHYPIVQVKMPRTVTDLFFHRLNCLDSESKYLLNVYRLVIVIFTLRCVVNAIIEP